MATKLARPRVPPTYVPRAHLDTLLDEGTMRPLTVLSAGAGWGKTLATAAWAASGPAVGPVAWVSLDPTDNQPRTFWSYVVAAIRMTAVVPADNPLAELVPGLGSERENLRRLADGLAELPQPVVLVLDDFGVITHPDVLAGISGLLRYPASCLRLVLLTRSDPVLPLHRLRVADDLREIRSRDLALNVTDAAALMAADGVVVAPEDAALLVERTEGWPVGLRLAALFLGRPGPARSAGDFAGDDQAVVEYLAEEVLTRQSPRMRRFLTRTSIAERVNCELAEVLTDEPLSQHHLEVLESSNTFVVGLGPGREWYRYHGLLQDMLRHRLLVEEPGVVPELHQRAAQWYADNDLPLEALRHAAAAGNWTLFGRLFVTQALPLSVSVDRAALDQVLATVPIHRVATGPELELAAATRLMFAGRIGEMANHLTRAEQLLETADPDTRAGASIGRLVLFSFLARARGDNDALIHAASAALHELSGDGAALPAANGYRAAALGDLGTGLLWSGRLIAAEQRLLEGLDVAEGTTLDASRINMLAHLGLATAASGRLSEAFRHATQATEIVRTRGWEPLPQAATAYLALAIVHLQWNDVDEAQMLLAEARAASALEITPRWATELAQIRLHASLGLVAAAREELSPLRDGVDEWQPPPFLARWLTITEAEVELAAGDPAAAVVRLDSGPPLDPSSSQAPERICRSRALLALGDPEAADEVLAVLRDERRQHGSVVEMWLLTALAAGRLREDGRSTDAVRRALQAAEPEGVRRPFVTLDQERLPRLLLRAKEMQLGSGQFLDSVLEDLGAMARRPPSTSSLPVPLTDRELSVLLFLPTMMTFGEIAVELYVSINTVKSHVRSIYSKFEVTSRRRAVQRAHELGLLSQ